MHHVSSFLGRVNDQVGLPRTFPHIHSLSPLKQPLNFLQGLFSYYSILYLVANKNMEFLDPILEEYVAKHTSAEPIALHELNRQTNLKVLQPRMLSGHIQGRVLSMFSHMIKPKRVLEIGTYTGYSAICLAEGLAPNGEVHTIDINSELETMVQDYVSKSGMEQKVHMHIGEALSLIPTLGGNWDLIFIDADKENYSNYFDAVIDDLAVGGFIIADNVLWSGKVVEDSGKHDEETAALVAYSNKIHADKRVENVLLPIRDGLMVCRKVA